MGLALADTDNDGDTDIFSTNVGNTIPKTFLRGDLKEGEIINPKWIMLRNDDDFNFTDITDGSKLDNYGFAWGAVFEDFNLDGILDLSVMQNYIKFPLHNFKKLGGELLLGTKSGTFESVTEESGVQNFNYGMTPLVSDFNKDGYLDLVNLNLDGKAKAFINNGGENKSLSIEIPTSVKYIDAKITTTLDNGEIIYRQYIPSQGLASSQSNKIIVPFKKDNKISKIVIKLSNGEVKTFDKINTSENIKLK
jgi:hypothetical protein